MKKLLKSGICGSMNSAWMHCSPWNSQLLRAKKRKKKGENAQLKTLNPNGFYVCFMGDDHMGVIPKRCVQMWVMRTVHGLKNY